MDELDELLKESDAIVNDAFENMPKSNLVLVTGRKRVRRQSATGDLTRLTKKAEKIAEEIVKEEEKKEKRAKRQLRRTRRYNGSNKNRVPLVRVDDDLWEQAELSDEFEKNNPDKIAMAIDIMGALMIIGMIGTGAHYAQQTYNEGYKVGTELMEDLRERLDNNREAEKAKWGPYYYILHPEEKPDTTQVESKEGDDLNGREIND